MQKKETVSLHGGKNGCRHCLLISYSRRKCNREKYKNLIRIIMGDKSPCENVTAAAAYKKLISSISGIIPCRRTYIYIKLYQR